MAVRKGRITDSMTIILFILTANMRRENVKNEKKRKLFPKKQKNFFLSFVSLPINIF